jgi:glycerophosphoryl diester phosphodiesterase
MSTQDLQAWPYPYWIAHRGAGKLAPENTLAAFRLGASLGHTCFECDVKLSSDDQAFLLHDADLKRTTDREGVAGALPWAALAKLDAGQWHSANHAGEPLPTLERIAGFIQRNGYTINLEIKPTPGTALHTGRVVAGLAQKLWAEHTPPLLSSFEVDALEGAKQSAPTLPRALLLDSWWDGWSDTAAHLGCVAIVCNHRILDAAMMAQARRVVQRVLVYTVNLDADVQRMRDVGVDGVITDAVDRYGQAR